MPSSQNNSPKPGRFPIVGVGASAGGLKAFQKLLSGMDNGTEAAYVLIQHLDPTHESILAELLQNACALPVKEVKGSMKVEAGKIYVIKPNCELTVYQGVLKAEPSGRKRGSRTPIDVFFRSLAHDQKEWAVGAVLSGSGSDGALGLKAIKAMGGMTIAQEPTEAHFDAMPSNAISSGGVDFLLKAEKIPEAVDRYLEHRRNSHLADAAQAVEEEVLLRILSLVRARTGHDFRHYKRATICRRVDRRVGLLQIKELDKYVGILEKDPEEVLELAQDLLISVTSFFRDAELWEALEKRAIPHILEGKKEGEDIRIWVPGCATGEEAYSLAILFTEAIERRRKDLKIQIYATDIDLQAREFARKAVYPSSIIHDVGRERLERFFYTDSNEHYRVRESLRDRVVFAKHNLISDPPFFNLDMVSCRNLLIYLNDAAQDRILKSLHFSLKDEGLLVLGNAESIGRNTELFNAFSKPDHIYRKLAGVPTLPRGGFNMTAKGSFPFSSRQPAKKDSSPGDFAGFVREKLSEHFKVGSLLVDEDMRILFQQGNLGLYLRLPEGVPTSDLLNIIRPDMRSRLMEVCRVCNRKDFPVRKNCLITVEEGERINVSITGRRVELPGTEERGYFFVFEASPTEGALFSPREGDTGDREEDSIVHQLENELQHVRLELRGTIEDLETSNEELRASNEEIMSMNAELQTSNEELETTREELQSLNEELYTLNAQLEAKLNELYRSNNDLNNLLRSSDLAVIFLDSDFRVQRYTKAATNIFHLIESDIGRSLSDLSSNLVNTGLTKEVERVLETLKPEEREIRSLSGQWYTRRILPYRTHQNRIDGVVITFSEITELKRIQADLEESEQFWRRLFQEAPLFIAITQGPEHAYLFQNDYHYRMTGRKNIIGMPLLKAFPELKDTEVLKRFDQVYQTGETVLTPEFPADLLIEGELKRGYYNQILQPWYNADGNVEGVLSLAFDITESVRMRLDLELSDSRFRAAGESFPYGVWWTDAEGQAEYISDSFCQLTGRSLEELKAHGWLDLLPEEDRRPTLDAWKRCVSEEKSWDWEHRFRAQDGSLRHVLAKGKPVRDGEGEVTGWVGINLDVTERKKVENALKEQELLLRVAIKCSPIMLFRQDQDLRYTWIFNHTSEKDADGHLGKSEEEVFPSASGKLRQEKQKVLETGRPRSFEFTLEQAGEQRSWIAFVEPSLHADGSVAGLIGAALDISDRIAFENELKEAKNLAESANRAKTTFLTSMSHDIRTPLTAILGFSEILSGMLEDDQHEMAESINSACEHLMGTLESVLQLARLEGKHSYLDCKNLSLREQVEITLNIYKAVEDKRNRHLAFRTELEDDDPVMVLCDGDALNRILNNILGNAFKFTEEGGTIQLILRRSPDGLPQVIIEDDGPGIGEEFIRQIFEPFTQERGKELKSLSGSGLGLAICRQLVELMGGRIWVESEEGQGSCFYVELQPGTDQEGESYEMESAPSTVADSSTLRLIVCDDHRNTCDVVRLMLPEIDIRCLENPLELQDQIDWANVVLLDIDFHGKALGTSILRRLKHHPNREGVRIVAFTAHGLPGQREAFLSEGFDGYLAKPFTREKLLSAIRGRD